MSSLIAVLLSISALAQVPPSVTPELHENVLKLVEAFGMKTYLQDSLDQAVAEGKAAALSRSPKFAEEWERRIHQRISVDDYIAIAARAFEKNLSLDEVKELIAVLQKRKSGQRADPSAQLAAKLNDVMPTLTRQVEAITSGNGAKAVKDVSDEIEKEHPEYLDKPSEPAKPAAPTLR